MRIPTDLLLVDPKDETWLELCNEAGATLQPTNPELFSFHNEMGRYVWWNKSYIISCLLARVKMQNANLERKEMLYKLDHINKP